MKRDSLNFGVVVLYILSAIGAYFVVLIVVFNYNFNDSTINTYLGYYLSWRQASVTNRVFGSSFEDKNPDQNK